jgi:hypothetical protein
VEGDLVADEVMAYWSEQTGVKVRSPKVRDAILARIAKRLDEGFGPADLKRCVDFAKYDEFYAENGYAKQPDVIWRSAERVQSILARCAHIASRPLPL